MSFPEQAADAARRALTGEWSHVSPTQALEGLDWRTAGERPGGAIRNHVGLPENVELDHAGASDWRCVMGDERGANGLVRIRIPTRVR